MTIGLIQSASAEYGVDIETVFNEEFRTNNLHYAVINLDLPFIMFLDEVLSEG